MRKSYAMALNEQGKPVFEAEKDMSDAEIEEAIKRHGVDAVVSAYALGTVAMIAEHAEVDIEGMSLPEAVAALRAWGEAMAKELGCKPNLPSILEAMKAQKKELSGARVHADLALAKLTPAEQRRCERKRIDPRDYARAKARLTLDEIKRLDATGGDVVQAAKEKDALSAIMTTHGLSEREARMCEEQKLDPARYAAKKRDVDARATRSGKAGAS